jgi:hypothetical protein
MRAPNKPTWVVNYHMLHCVTMRCLRGELGQDSVAGKE